MKISATARIQVTVEVDGGTWGSECSMEQVFDQAKKEASIGVQSAIQKSYPRGRVIGEPIVLAILTKRED